MPGEYAPLSTNEEVNHYEIGDASDDEDDHSPRGNRDQQPLLHKSSTSNVKDEDDEPNSPLLDTSRSLLYSAPAPPIPGSYESGQSNSYIPQTQSPPITAYGNSNGSIPTGPASVPLRPNMLTRALERILPTQYVRDLRGGGVGNDGVFANISAKPAVPNGPRDPNSGLHSSEEASTEVPPSYASAQADAVPAYGDTLVSATTQTVDGELIVDLMPIGSVFSFLWNLLVSMSFQFVGFLLTYLLHSTHAAKFGSRAGLGVTLIQYGFYLRSRMDRTDDPVSDNGWGWPVTGDQGATPSAKPSFATAEDARKYYEALSASGTNSTSTAFDPETLSNLQATATTANEWISFLLMTIGWFVLLTALLGFWRVKRWEREVRRAARDAANPPPPPTAEQLAREREIISNIEAAFGLVSTRVSSGAESIRQGLGLPHNWQDTPGEGQRPEGHTGR